jgi:hypothetical protein
MRSYLKRMYSNTSTEGKMPKVEKNPNRVAGGLRAQGVNSFTMLGEDGQEKEVPSQKYVNSLEEQVRKLKDDQGLMQRKIARQDTNVQRLAAIVDQLKNR